MEEEEEEEDLWCKGRARKSPYKGLQLIGLSTAVNSSWIITAQKKKKKMKFLISHKIIKTAIFITDQVYLHHWLVASIFRQISLFPPIVYWTIKEMIWKLNYIPALRFRGHCGWHKKWWMDDDDRSLPEIQPRRAISNRARHLLHL